MRRLLFQGSQFAVSQRRVELPGGERVWVETVSAPDVVRVYPLQDGGVWLIRELRPELGRLVLRVVSGRIRPGEDALRAAARELREEIGGVAENPVLERRSRPILKVESDVYHVRCGISAFVAPEPEPGEQGIEAELVPLARVERMVLDGELVEDTVALQLLMLARRAGTPPQGEAG